MSLCIEAEEQETLSVTHPSQHRQGGILILSISQVVGLCLGAFALGVLIPNLLIVTSPPATLRNANHLGVEVMGQSDSATATNKDQNASFNNLLASSLTTRTADEASAPKIAWRKYHFEAIYYFLPLITRSEKGMILLSIREFLVFEFRYSLTPLSPKTIIPSPTSKSHVISQFGHFLYSRFGRDCQQHEHGHQLWT